ncbi:hypothetical protein DFA_12074 [Cavenderia fasciculata]|uniref:Uncharacterized protein n=1 Tax=Cavenderia fasciculata TaxID=261658 RepID=F4QFQ7_CACFS|nr:uncharacterized protein DFA_12074 [Cavenderia fasciculata]EGG14304.1 hypothetical protein DFA_12074 [Cavenderia fasciculata]|eukprot:XP_004351013.1 hypothetical protein DFA_12074 [Cavenderia fasciculata]
MIRNDSTTRISSKSLPKLNRSTTTSTLLFLVVVFLLSITINNINVVNGEHYIVEWNNPVVSNLTISVGDTVTWITSDMEMNTVTLIERIPIYLDHDNQVTFENPKLKYQKEQLQLQQQQQTQTSDQMTTNQQLLLLQQQKEKEKEQKEKDQKYSYSFDSPISFNNPKYHQQPQQQTAASLQQLSQQQQQQQTVILQQQQQEQSNLVNPSLNLHETPTRRRYSFTFTQEGLYLYSSKYNPETMQGTVQVLPIVYDPDANSSSKQSLWSLCFAFFIGLLMFFIFN